MTANLAAQEAADPQASSLRRWLDSCDVEATDHDRRVVEGPTTSQDDERVERMRAGQWSS